MSVKKSNTKVDLEVVRIDESNSNQPETILEAFPEANTGDSNEVVKLSKLGKPSKQQIIINLLSREGGACLEEMIKATNWKKHSIRGAISGGIKKKLGIKVQSRITGNVLSYFIEASTNNPEA